MSEQIGLMESELETNSYRYYYDKWIEIEGGFSKDVLKKRFRELADDEKKLDEIINFIMYLDSQLSYQESSKRYENYFDEGHTIFKVLQIPAYQEYWQKYINSMYVEGTFFTKSIDNTIKLVNLSKNSMDSNDDEKVQALIAQLDANWEREQKSFRERRIKRKAEKRRVKINEDKEIQKILKNNSSV